MSNRTLYSATAASLTNTPTRTLHAHQVRAIDQIRESLLDGVSRVVLQGPTGFGKTVVMGDIIRRALDKRKRVLVIVSALSLIDQTVISLAADGIRQVGVIQGRHHMTDWSKPVQVASVQTLQNRKALPDVDLVIIDECHRWFKFYGALMAREEFAKVPFIGLSATPWTKGLGKHFDGLLIPATTADLIAQGFLSPFRVFAPSHPDLSGVGDVAGDYHEGQLSTAMRKPKLVADVVAAWLEHGEGRPTLCFAVDRAHAQAIKDRFTNEGVACGYIDGTTPQIERERIRKGMERRSIQVTVNIGCLTTGTDWPFISCISLCRPTKSEMLYVQIVGRGLRTAPGKADCIVLDHSDTTERLGFVTDIVHDHLDDGTERTAAKAKAKAERRERPCECTSCGALRRPLEKACWSCGHESKRPSKVEHVAGELVAQRAKPKAATKADKQSWYSGLLGHGYAKFYKSGWAANKYREKFGVWPRGLREIPMPPTGEQANWIRSRQIAHSHRRPAGGTYSGGARP